MFEPTRSLLNPKFEGYKLDALDQDKLISRFPLQYKPSQTTLSGRTPLSFQEVQSRIRHNHLAIGPAQKAVYVDAEYRVISISVDEGTLVPSLDVLYELPRQIQTAAQDLPQREYPSVVFLTANILLVADGFGTLYVLKTEGDRSSQLLKTFELIIPEAYESSRRNAPFRLHQALQTSPEVATALLSSKYYPSDDVKASEKSKNPAHSSNVRFDLWSVQFNWNSGGQVDASLDIVWHRRGEDVPQFIAHDASRNATMLLGSCPYSRLHVPAPASYEPTSNEIAPIPRLGETLDAQPETPPPPPYSWTQTTDSVTVAFALPSSTPKSAIRVNFSPRTLTVLVAEEATLPFLPIPQYTAKVLWDGIQPSTSLWTWDKEDSHSYGVLTVHLDKQHEGTRWMQVFASPNTSSTTHVSPQDVEVPETLDPSELYNIRESMEKFTAAALEAHEKGSIPSLAEGEMDEEIDSEMGKWSFITWVGDDGSEPSWVDDRGMDAPLSILSTSLPGLSTSIPSIIVKNGLDGVVFALEKGTSPADPPAWKHTSTFSALSFVLASKRDTRFVHHYSTKAALAFESGSHGNVYIYRNTAGVHDEWAKQAVLKIASGMAGSLLGVGIIKTTQGRPLILALCEGELVVAHDVL
ncbi:hypothetical protein EUX98_g6195 [Antrodiella citrinella]|uniref:NudC domain-containing protein 1 n=1 Tax=Antrodiella citrinella TaxID=2447956 RepID=A0A4S4MPQ3_9APHY|nr:hypothetical protein EUX98_g6195 [Antrodiella citrinella]